MSDTEGVVHVVGLDIIFSGDHRRQRCAWCGQLLEDEHLSRQARLLNPDGTDPGPAPAWPVGALVEVTGELGGGRVMCTVDLDEDGTVPANCCMRLDPAVTR